MNTTTVFQKLKPRYLVCLIVMLGLMSVAYQGCDTSGNGSDIFLNPYGNTNRSLYTLKQFESCDDFLESIKERTINEMEEIIQETMENTLDYGLYCYYYSYIDDAAVYSGNSTVELAASDDSASEYSETNNQVAGVDEADFVKNDGGYIYILADDKFKVIDAWPTQNAHTLSSYVIEGTPKKLYINNNHALIFSSLDKEEESSTYPGFYPGSSYYDQECTYGYNCDFTGDGKNLKITVLDISDPANPILKRELRFDGTFINTRRINNAVHTVVLFPELTIDGVEYWPESLSQCWDYEEETPSDAEIIKAFEDLMAKNRDLIENSDISDWLPNIQDTHYTNAGPVVYDALFDCTGLYESPMKNGNAIMSLVSFDMTGLDEIRLTSILGNAGAVYASASAIYISSRHQYHQYSPWFYDTNQEIKEASTVHKFNITNSPPDCTYAASGVVKGRVLNQFSMDEFDGYLRIASTTGNLPSPDVHSTLNILKEVDNYLEISGNIDNIAPEEDIRSVRFDGSRGFIVTFKKTDPLFALNLSDPFSPFIEGELKIPGYSTYMHMMDENHLLTIGYDADDQGSFAWFDGIMLQIFDISDMSAPKKLADEVIGTRGSSSEAATNHLAFNYYASKNILALPMTICEGGSGGTYGDTMTFSGLLVYNVTTQGFKEKGRVYHMDGDLGEYSCNNWWTDSNTVVKRSIIMDNFIYSVALDKIKIQNMDNLGYDVCVVDLTE